MVGRGMMGWYGLLVVGVYATIVPHSLAMGEDVGRLPDDVKALCRQYVGAFGSDRTELVYHHRLNGPLGMGNIPGGHVEPDETPEQCIVREITEEMNLFQPKPARLTGRLSQPEE